MSNNTIRAKKRALVEAFSSSSNSEPEETPNNTQNVNSSVIITTDELNNLSPKKPSQTPMKSSAILQNKMKEYGSKSVYCKQNKIALDQLGRLLKQFDNGSLTGKETLARGRKSLKLTSDEIVSVITDIRSQRDAKKQISDTAIHEAITKITNKTVSTDTNKQGLKTYVDSQVDNGYVPSCNHIKEKDTFLVGVNTVGEFLPISVVLSQEKKKKTIAGEKTTIQEKYWHLLIFEQAIGKWMIFSAFEYIEELSIIIIETKLNKLRDSSSILNT
ncbi:predicted protein [Naegleria gruberi]|uniref:Predicted protein n=1 Tax=Naegleria gruberi TaxID=5762 RepID=D2VMW4_NAEGR|nr:uncharacterized protein NAEGRDRAFT_70283 [Naegleria gruberi]EFC41813.1 predicted protein [Naegleria gruberi]|eukprot:XP_002674557.1 predicted protein [Naegleria gruberi strain NEG-M]